MQPEPSPLVLDLRSGAGDDGWLQQVAGEALWCDRRLMPVATPAARPAEPPPREAEPITAVYDGPGLVDGRLQRIRSSVAGNGVRRVEMADGEAFLVGADGVVVARLAPAASALGERTIERALGAPLALALALRDVHLLHASALAGARGVAAITAASGVGKSTLAAAAARFPELDLERVADDQLAVRLAADAAALPHFPQLKLPRAQWYPASGPASLPLVALVEISVEERRAAADRRAPEVERLDHAAGCVALARATVAARLFDGDLLARHLDACARAASAVEVVRLRYGRGRDRLRAPLAAIAELLA